MDDFYLLVYKNFISDYIVSNDEDYDDMFKFLNEYVSNISQLSHKEKVVLKDYIKNELFHYFYDHSSIPNEEITFLNDEIIAFHHIPLIH